MLWCNGFRPVGRKGQSGRVDRTNGHQREQLEANEGWLLRQLVNADGVCGEHGDRVGAVHPLSAIGILLDDLSDQRTTADDDDHLVDQFSAEANEPLLHRAVSTVIR